ncbi:hypothetical protein PT974_02021 [Cladobotryum mycophilum]|uniref:Uncharacterized protein n=1 Tax=Cladobotryum mycophilum TaxID=491253 RepID=A0ABR0SY69_9HYPO
MRFSGVAALLLSGGALAISRPECLNQRSAEIAGFSACAHKELLGYCLSQLDDDKLSEIDECYRKAGCSDHEAAIEAKYATERCEELAHLGELRKRYRAALQPEQTPVVLAGRAAMPAPTPLLDSRDDKLQCLTTETVKTSTCPVQTNGAKLKTLSCFPTEVAKSRCGPGLMCSLDSTGKDVCMKMHNGLDIGGIIIAVIFGVVIVIGVAALTFMCCKERRYQKRLEARAEATALARAQTKKARAAEARAPLMRQAEGGGADPFHDRNQS